MIAGGVARGPVPEIAAGRKKALDNLAIVQRVSQVL